jgi:phytoene synthase
MNSDHDLSPPVRLALAYAPLRVRASFAVLLRLDDRLANIVANVTEPLIGQMKLAWWRDAINAAAGERPKGEPLLSGLFALDDPMVNDAAVRLVDAWEILIVEHPWSALSISRFATERGQAVFDAYSSLTDKGGPSKLLAAQWARDDLRKRFGDRVPHVKGDPAILPKGRIFRPLTILAMSVRDVSGPRVIWHALTGR